MSASEDQKRIWKEESEQQRQDNLKKRKVIQRREVPITFGKKKASNSGLFNKNQTQKESGFSDDILRRNLGI